MLASIPMPSGDFGTWLTLWQMRSLVGREYLRPEVRLNAASIVAGCDRTDGAQAAAIRGWVEDHTQFLRDPDGVEMLHGPSWMMRRIATGTLYVDCDDVAMLTAALGKAVGLRARFVVVGFGSPRAPYRHVWTELAAPGSRFWVECDITRPAQGLPPGAVSRRLTVRV